MRTGVAVLIPSLLALAAASAVVAAPGDPAQPSCNAALVRYEWNRGTGGAPWVTVGPTKSRLEGWLYSYHIALLEDARVNRSERLMVRAGVQEKIGWFSRKWGGNWLTVVGRRLDGPGSFRQRFRAAYGDDWYPSGLMIPATGCWELTLKTNGWTRRLVAQAIEPPAEGTCDPTPVPAGGQIPPTPRRSRIVAGWGPWLTPEGGALLYTGGRTPEGGFTKVLWRTTRDAGTPIGDMTLLGTQLDGNSRFRQTLHEVGAGGPWPSHVVVPNPGCWLLTARIGGLPGAAGILVVRVV